MNNIIIENDSIKEINLDSNIKCNLENKTHDFNVNKVIIDVADSCDITIEYKSKEKTKLDIHINAMKNIVCNIYEKITGLNLNRRVTYNIDENSKINIYKMNDIKEIKENIIINLNKENAKVNYTQKSITTNIQKYDMAIYHNAKKTTSEIINNFINIENGEIKLNVSTFIKKGQKESTANQENKIINLTNNECIIKPNLFIDESDIVANHSAFIGNFNEEELFYLQSRGINHESSIKLLTQSLLSKNIENEEFIEYIKEKINTYWR